MSSLQSVFRGQQHLLPRTWKQLEFPPSATSHQSTFLILLQGHPGQLLCWDEGLYHLCSKRGKCAYALSQCTQQGEAHPSYLIVTCRLFWVIGGEWCSNDQAPENLADKQVVDRYGFEGVQNGNRTGLGSSGCHLAEITPTPQS